MIRSERPIQIKLIHKTIPTRKISTPNEQFMKEEDKKFFDLIDELSLTSKTNAADIFNWAHTSDLAKCFTCDIVPAVALPMYNTNNGHIFLPLQEYTLDELENLAWKILIRAADLKKPIKRKNAEIFFIAHDLYFNSFITRNEVTIAVTDPLYLGILAIKDNKAGLCVLNPLSVIRIED